MSTLLLQLVGPMQSWDVHSDSVMRDTGREPSKSGVIGLLCAALGWPRTQSVEQIARLANLRMGVRVDQEGRKLRDFHTAGKDGFYRASGDVERKNVILSRRYYLADACFLVGLETDDIDLLTMLHNKLRDPYWVLYLGRKAFVPSKPVWLPKSLKPSQALIESLRTYPWLSRKKPSSFPLVRMVIEDTSGNEVRTDQPISFAPRQFTPRHVMNQYWSVTPEEDKEVNSCIYPV